jgi:putative transcriptional regulator
MSHLDTEQLQDLALGVRNGPYAELAVAHVERCSECRGALIELEEMLSRFASALPACAPAPKVRARLLAEIEGAERYAPFTARVASLFALDASRAASLLVRAADPAAYRSLPIAGVAIAKAESGSELGAAQACFLRAEPGTRYPRHEHGGEERVLVLEGAYLDDAGHEARAGDLALGEPGAAHSFVVLEGAPCVSAIVSTGPIRILG